MEAGDQLERDLMFKLQLHCHIEHCYACGLTMTKELSAALQNLASYRAQNTRASQQTFEQGLVVLKSNAPWKRGEDGEFPSRAQTRRRSAS